MRLNPITDRENRNFSVPKAGMLGAAVGYLGTYALPLTTEEHEKYFTQTVQNGIEEKAKNARKSEIKLIKEQFKEGNVSPLVKDIFERSTQVLESDPKNALKDVHKRKDINRSVKDTIGNLYKRVYNSGKVAKMTEEASVSMAAKKDNRAALYYAGIGALVLMSLAVVKNSIDTFLPKKSAEKEDTNPTITDFLINSVETNDDLFIFEKDLEN